VGSRTAFSFSSPYPLCGIGEGRENKVSHPPFFFFLLFFLLPGVEEIDDSKIEGMVVSPPLPPPSFTFQPGGVFSFILFSWPAAGQEQQLLARIDDNAFPPSPFFLPWEQCK